MPAAPAYRRCVDGTTVVPWSCPHREEEIHSLLTEEFDVLVVGGGCVGAGVALDAATRGLKVALVEREDFASGTSSRSTKLVHGGIRWVLALVVTAAVPTPAPLLRLGAIARDPSRTRLAAFTLLH